MLKLVSKSNSNISITKSTPNYANKKIQQKKQHQTIQSRQQTIHTNVNMPNPPLDINQQSSSPTNQPKAAQIEDKNNLSKEDRR